QFLNLFAAEDNLARAVGAKTPEELIGAIDSCSARPAGSPGTTPVPSVTLQTPLARAIETLVQYRMDALPVVDAEGNLVGELTAGALLQLGVREHFLHLASTASLRQGEPIEAVLRLHAESPLETLGVIGANGFRTVQEDEPL